MNNEQTIEKNPPRSLGVPTAPVPQTNMGLLEHSGIPFEPQDQITDIPPDFGWMASQWKYVDKFTISVTNEPNKQIYWTPVVASLNDITYPYWTSVPFSFSKWWTGAISYRFTAIKPPRVTGKLIIQYRQDGFRTVDDDTVATQVTDSIQRSIAKEWDLSQSSQFEFDLTGSVPIRARPAQWVNGADPFKIGKTVGTAFAVYNTPWVEREMGEIKVRPAQFLSPGGIFPDSFTILVEKSIKTPSFMTPTDSRTAWILATDKEPSYIVPT